MCCCCRATETRVGNSAFYSLSVYYQSALEQGFFFPASASKEDDIECKAGQRR